MTAASEQKFEVVFVLGGPGVGKGTLCGKAIEKYGSKLATLSAGELLRQECADPNSQYGRIIADDMRNGTIVPAHITCSLLGNAMQKIRQSEGTNWFLIDGFPRNQANVQGWTETMSERATLRGVLVFQCPDDVCMQRCLRRGETSGRADDNSAALVNRLRQHKEDSLPVINWFESQNLVTVIDSNRDFEVAFLDVCAALTRFGFV